MKPKITITLPNPTIPFLIFIVLCILKCFINISWISVTSPLWIYFLWCFGWLIIALIIKKIMS